MLRLCDATPVITLALVSILVVGPFAVALGLAAITHRYRHAPMTAVPETVLAAPDKVGPGTDDGSSKRAFAAAP